jgi:BolA protein
MSIEASITRKLQQELEPGFLDVRNESHMHSGPAAESHFRLYIVADAFEGLSSVKRHQRVYGILAQELAGGVHALALQTYTPDEWKRTEMIRESPQCMGGGKEAK